MDTTVLLTSGLQRAPHDRRPQVARGNMHQPLSSLGNRAVLPLITGESLIHCDTRGHTKGAILKSEWGQQRQRRSTRACSSVKNEGVGSEDDHMPS